MSKDFLRLRFALFFPYMKNNSFLLGEVKHTRLGYEYAHTICRNLGRKGILRYKTEGRKRIITLTGKGLALQEELLKIDKILNGNDK